MKELPILFSNQMVQALLDERKTMTRRTRGLEEINASPDEWVYVGCEVDVHEFRNKRTGNAIHMCSSYGKPGDVLWVRESFCYSNTPNPEVLNYQFKDGIKGLTVPEGDCYKISDYERLRPSIHMPKVAARIWMEVERVTVERVLAISDADAIAEGIEKYTVIDELIAYKNYSQERRKDFLHGCDYSFDYGNEIQSAPVASFCTLWISINSRDSWTVNPWVWVIKYKVLSTTGKPEISNSPTP